MDLKSYDKIRITLVGLGGTGSYLTSFLCHLIGMSKILSAKIEITLVDGDVVEKKNLRNQKYLHEDIEKYKAEVLYDRYSSIYHDIKLKYANSYIEDLDQAINYVIQPYSNNADTLNILVSCVDNYKVRKIFDELFHIQGKLRDLIYIDTGNNIGDKLNGQTVVGYRIGELKQVPDNNGRYDYYRSKYLPKIILPPPSAYFPEILTAEDIEIQPSCGDTNDSTVQNLGANITSATTTFNILNNILCFNKIPGEFYLFDGLENRINKVG